MESAVLDPARKTSKKCQIEGCHEITVGSRTALCRKHRNNKYKQNYNKKKKRKAHGSEEMPSESIENQLAEEKCLMEQKYASMLQQVLAQKQLELLQSEKVIQVLRAHQQKVKQDKIKEIQERKIKKEQEPKEAKDQESVVSEVSSLSTEDGVTDKSNSKATKTPKKSHQSKKSAGKAVTSKDARTGNNINFSGNMDTTSKQLVPSSGFVTKTLYTGVNTSPALGMNNGSYISGQNSQPPNGSHQVVPIQPLSMTIQQFPKIDSIFSYQANSLGSVTNTGGYAKICIDNTLKDLSVDPSGGIVTSTVTSSNQLQPSLGAGKEMSSADGNNFVILDSKVMQSVKTRLQQNASYQIMQKVNLPSRNTSSQGDHQRELYPSLMAPCTSRPATTGSNLGAVVGMVQQNPGNFPVMNLSQAMSLSNGQITSSGPTPVPQKIQGVMAQSWPNQIMPGRVQAPTMQDDFLLQMLQDSKDTQVQHGAQSQTNSALTSVNHVMTDQSWAMSIGM